MCSFTVEKQGNEPYSEKLKTCVIIVGVNMVSVQSITKEALVGSITLGVVFVTGYVLGKSDSV